MKLSGRLLAAVTFAVVVAACGGSKQPALPVGVSDPRPPSAAKKPANVPPLSGHLVASIGGGAIGPFAARRGEGEAAVGLVAWVTGAEGSARRIVGVPTWASGAARDVEKTIALVPVDTTTLVVRPLRGATPGFVVAWTSLTDRGESLWAAVVGDDAVPRGKAIELVRTNDDVVWVDVVPTDAGAVCVWAEETRAGDANLAAAALEGDGRVRGAPSRVGRGATGWHALEMPSGVGVSIVSATGKTSAGTLSFQKLDVDAHPAGPPTVVWSKPTVSGDVEVARAADRVVFAWTDRTTDEPAVAAASLDDHGSVEAPKRVVEGRGGASLLGLAAGPAGVGVLFEAPARAVGKPRGATERRRVHLTRIGKTLAMARRPSTFEVFGRATPEIAATSSGFAVLAPLRDCVASSPTCEDVPAVATLQRFDEHLAVVQKEPLSFDGDAAPIGWGLTCEAESCFALTATGGGPLRVRTAEIRSRTNVPPRAAPPPPPKDAPRVEDLAALSTGEAIVDVAAAKLGDSIVVALLSATSDSTKAPSVMLSARLVDATGNPATPPVTLASRALAVGGVSVAAAEKPEDGAAIAWVARDNGDPEVHVTRVDKRGKRLKDIQLTTAKGDATDVAIAWAQGGWVVAWVDGRDGNGEVYTTKVTPDLGRVAREERITTAPGDASDLVALAKGDLVWLAWADPRESPRDGVADVYVAAVRARDAKKAVDETRLLPTAAHSRTPQLANAGEAGVHVAWIEEAPMGIETPSSSGFGAMWTTLDAAGKPSAKPVRLPLAGEGAATSVAIEQAGRSPRAVVARSTADLIALDAVDLGASSPRAFELLTLDGPPSLDVALVLQGGFLFFNDDGPTAQDRRARRARIAWGPRSEGGG